MNLRVRILAGYGVVLALASGLALFLTMQLGALNHEIAALNASSVAGAEAGWRIAARVAELRQAVDGFLQYPSPETRAAVEQAFGALDTELVAMREVGGTAASTRHRAIAPLLDGYRASWRQLSGLLDEQDRLGRDAAMRVFEAGVLSGHEITGEFVVPRNGLDGIAELTDAQQSLQLASLLIGRAVSEQDQASASRALEQVKRAQALLTSNAARPAPSSGMLEALSKATMAVTTTGQLVANIGQVRLVHDQRLVRQAIALSDQATAIVTDEMQALASATTSLERQVFRTQQLAGLALLGTVVTAALVGVSLARSLARPLVQLAAAVARVNGGDYDAVVEQRSGGEIGQLATAFNQMTATLRHQRDEMAAQQAATTARNAELEQALDELRAATAARDELANTVRALSVPVVPLMRRVIAVPLVGEIDAERAAVLLERLLAGVTSEGARVVILDITGVPFVDASVAEWLLKSAAAAELLGARCVLTGISPEVAQALVASGAELGRLVTRADMRAGVEYAMSFTRT